MEERSDKACPLLDTTQDRDIGNPGRWKGVNDSWERFFSATNKSPHYETTFSNCSLSEKNFNKQKSGMLITVIK